MTTTLNIKGMHCGGCAGSIERALSGVAGVHSVKVDHQKGRAVVEHDDATPSTSLTDVVNGIGFLARLAER